MKYPSILAPHYSYIIIAFISLLLYSSCTKNDSTKEDLMVDDVQMELDTIPLEVGEYDPFYVNSFWEYKNARTIYDDVINDDVPDSLTTCSYYHKTALRNTFIYEKKHRLILTENFESENFQVVSSSSKAYHYFENDVYYINNRKYLDLNLDVGEGWNSDTTASDYPGGIIQNFTKYSIVDKNTSIAVNGETYNDVVIVSCCNYSKLDIQDRFECEVAEYRYYAKNIGLIHYSFAPPFRCTLIDLLDYQIEE